MEKNTGGVSLGIRFSDSGNGLEDYSAVESQSLIGIYDGDWSLEEDGTVNASMVFARRVGNIRSYGNLIYKVRGIGERDARVSISGCLGIEGERVELDGRLLNDPMSHGGVSFSCREISTNLYIPDTFEDNQKIEVVSIVLRVGAVALHCTGLPLDKLRKSPVKHFSSDKVDKFVSRFHGNVDFGSEWRKYKEIAKDLMAI